jgi:hypothetical protein
VAKGDFEPAARLVRPLTTRDDEIGAQALVLATEATAGAGDLRAAEQFGERARARLGDDPKLAASFGAVLARRGRLEDALTLLDAATERARVGGDEAFAARLAAEAADVASDIAQAEAKPFADAIDRTRNALAELRRVGDRRRYAQSVDALFGMINIDYPHEALALATDAADVAHSLGDDVAYGRAVYRICDAALDLNDVVTFERWRPELEALHLPAMQRAEADVLTTTYSTLRSGDLEESIERFSAFVERMRGLGEPNPVEPSAAAVCAALWQGRVAEATTLLETHVGDSLPPLHRAIVELIIRALAGPPWPLDDLPRTDATLANPERAMLHLLRGERGQADALLQERFVERSAVVGTFRQRFTPFFPGALVLALGPPGTQPDHAWLEHWIHDAPLPGLWPVNRAIAAILLAEQHHERRDALARAALALIEPLRADDRVAGWITQRAETLLETSDF